MTHMTCSEFTHEFTYAGAKGPAHWGEYCPDCAQHQQSPINLVTHGVAAENHGVSLHYRRANQPQPDIALINNGHTIKATYTSGSLVYNGVTYHAQQYHFHTPSEHTINGQSFGIEMHIVHQSDAGEYAVLGYMIEVRESGWQAVDQLFERFLKVPNKGDTYTAPGTSLDSHFPTTSPCYMYAGSFTTPPCTEGVRWFVLSEPSYISQSIYDRVKHVMFNNNRPVQPLAGRAVTATTITT